MTYIASRVPLLDCAKVILYETLVDNKILLGSLPFPPSPLPHSPVCIFFGPLLDIYDFYMSPW